MSLRKSYNFKKNIKIIWNQTTKVKKVQDLIQLKKKRKKSTKSIKNIEIDQMMNNLDLDRDLIKKNQKKNGEKLCLENIKEVIQKIKIKIIINNKNKKMQNHKKEVLKPKIK